VYRKPMQRDRQPCVYILASKANGYVYIGVTSNLMQRIYQHREGIFSGYSKEKNTKLLVRFEIFDRMHDAITREKRLKNWMRNWKIELIESQNLYWEDLAIGLGFDRLAD
jgi:putative endonuclease